MTDLTGAQSPEEGVPGAGTVKAETAVTDAETREHSEEIMRIRVEPEDRLAFRVGVNILTLVLIGLGVWLIWRNFFSGN